MKVLLAAAFVLLACRVIGLSADSGEKNRRLNNLDRQTATQAEEIKILREHVADLEKELDRITPRRVVQP